jgi:hypothetical protein
MQLGVDRARAPRSVKEPVGYRAGAAEGRDPAIGRTWRRFPVNELPRQIPIACGSLVRAVDRGNHRVLPAVPCLVDERFHEPSGNS